MVDAGRKQLEHLLQQLNEQLLINISQQTHFSSSPANAKQIASLQTQQQQIMAQMQLTQQALTLGQESPQISGPNSLETLLKDGMFKPGKQRERHLSETVASVVSDGSLKENHRPLENNNSDRFKLRSQQPVASPESGFEPKTSSPVSPARPLAVSPGFQASGAAIAKLFSHGHCNWPGCDSAVGSEHDDDFKEFQRHLASSHPLDDKSTAQTRVQLQIVGQLEMQLSKEKERLEAMTKHLQLEITKAGDLKPIKSTKPASPTSSPSHLHLLQSSIERGSLVRLFLFQFYVYFKLVP